MFYSFLLHALVFRAEAYYNSEKGINFVLQLKFAAKVNIFFEHAAH